MNFLVLAIGCAECTDGSETLVDVMGVFADLMEAKSLPGDVDWKECPNGWYWPYGRMGEYRIIDLTTLKTN